MQDVVGHEIVAHEAVDLLPRPVGERVQLDQAALRVERGERRRGAVGRLAGPQPGEPAARAGERAAERLDLAEAAAGLPGGDRAPEAVDALGPHEFLRGRALGRVGGDPDAVGRFGLGPGVVGLGEEAAGIEGDDLDAPLREARHGQGVGERLILDPEARREDEAAGDLRGDQVEAAWKVEPGQPLREEVGRLSVRTGHRAMSRGSRDGKATARAAPVVERSKCSLYRTKSRRPGALDRFGPAVRRAVAHSFRRGQHGREVKDSSHRCR